MKRQEHQSDSDEDPGRMYSGEDLESDKTDKEDYAHENDCDIDRIVLDKHSATVLSHMPYYATYIVWIVLHAF